MRCAGLADRGTYHPSQPTASGRFREHTANHAKMAGVTEPRFKCACCGGFRPTIGRKRVSKHIRDGYKCADCASLRTD